MHEGGDMTLYDASAVRLLGWRELGGSHARNRRAHCLVRLLVLARKRRGMHCLVRLLVLLLVLVRHAAPLGAKGLANLCAQ